ncbi:MAG TPA: hypothetical protein VFC76_08155 [Oscillospiraceae bacterium]|nr:hypothetical protein [Oscillospiraceae bacterium]
MKKRSLFIAAGAITLALLTVFVILLSKNRVPGTRLNGNSTNASGTQKPVGNTDNNIGVTGNADPSMPQNTEKYQMYSNSSATKFEYELKSSYNSREEVLREIDDLNTCYKYFCDKKESSVVSKAKETRDGLMNILEEKIKAYPPSDEEILKSKTYVMEQRIDGLAMLVYTAEFDLNNRPDNEEYRQIYQTRKAEYDEAKGIEDKYKNGEITVDQALERLGINYTGLPY